MYKCPADGCAVEANKDLISAQPNNNTVAGVALEYAPFLFAAPPFKCHTHSG
jgi:hypothetical protein